MYHFNCSRARRGMRGTWNKNIDLSSISPKLITCYFLLDVWKPREEIRIESFNHTWSPERWTLFCLALSKARSLENMWLRFLLMKVWVKITRVFSVTQRDVNISSAHFRFFCETWCSPGCHSLVYTFLRNVTPSSLLST